VSLVISFASVPTFVEPHAGQVGRVGSSIDMQPPVSGARDFTEATVHRGRNAKKVVGTVADPRLSAQQFLLHLLRRGAVRPEQATRLVAPTRDMGLGGKGAVLALLPTPVRGKDGQGSERA